MKPSERFRTSHFVVGVIGSILAAIVVIASIGRFVGFTRVGDTLEGADPKWLVICLLGQIVVFAGYAGAMRIAFEVEGGAPLTPGLALKLTLASFAATQLFAFAGIGGLALVYIVLRRYGRDRRSAAVTLIGLSTSVYMVFALIALANACVALARADAPLSMTVPWLIGVPLIFVAARWFTHPERLRRMQSRVGGPIKQALATGVASAAWARARLSDRNGRVLLSWGACYWIGDVASLWAALRAFGAEPPLTAVLAAYTAGYLVQSLPIPLIATAGVDAATTLLLHVVGVPLDIALLGVVAHRIFAFWLPIVPGSVFALGIVRERTPKGQMA